ncbi:MAG TPA: hypothetical protein VFK05_39195 [Polyangiaceae bacterium]|nr:hypothetical protein [Polyangiaceae bacterium]
MASRRSSFRFACFSWCALWLSACAHDPRIFRLRAPVLRDRDLDPVRIDCSQNGEPRDLQAAACTPELYESSFSWDAVDNSLFRPMSKFFQVDSYGEAENVNAFDEVPDSSWFTNRIGARLLSPDEVARGYCAEGPELESDPAAFSWLVDHGKDNGANPGFRVNVRGQKYLLKTDDGQVERATAAAAIAARFYYAAGWWAPCDSVVYFKKSALRLKPGLSIKANVGPAEPFDQKRLDRILAQAGRRGELYRAVASRWLPGVPLGPFTYEGTRSDDPSDVIAHENRRDLRGARLLAAWLNHFDSREQNTMSTWMSDNPRDSASQGYVRHWYIDLGDCFGSEWAIDDVSKRLGHAYLLDFSYMLEDFASFGAIERPWDRARRTPGAENFGYFSERDFEPELWRGEYPNPAFGRMTERDGAWATRIIARFSVEHIRAAVGVGNFTNPAHAEFLVRVLLARQRRLLARYFSKLSPLSDVQVTGRKLCATDLARSTGTYPSEAFSYRAELRRGSARAVTARAVAGAQGQICVDLGEPLAAGLLSDAAPGRYMTVRIENGIAPGPLVVHFYDLGADRGLRLVGIERPG